MHIEKREGVNKPRDLYYPVSLSPPPCGGARCRLENVTCKMYYALVVILRTFVFFYGGFVFFFIFISFLFLFFLSCFTTFLLRYSLIIL